MRSGRNDMCAWPCRPPVSFSSQLACNLFVGGRTFPVVTNVTELLFDFNGSGCDAESAFTYRVIHRVHITL